MEQETQSKDIGKTSDTSDLNLSDEKTSAVAVASRSERKSMREKKRRSELNNALDSLASTLYAIDPTMECAYMSKNETGEHPPLKKKIKSDVDTNIANRVDLINYSVNVLKRVNEENEARKLLIAELLHITPNLRGASNQGSSQRNNTEIPHGFHREGALVRNDLAQIQRKIQQTGDESIQARLSRITTAHSRLGTSILDNSNSLAGHSSNAGLQPLSSYSTIPGRTSIHNTSQLSEINPYSSIQEARATKNSLRPNTQDYINATSLAMPQNTRGFPNLSETIAQRSLLNLLQSSRNQQFSNSPNIHIPGNTNTLIPPSQGIAESLLSSQLQPDIAALQHFNNKEIPPTSYRENP
eukprot:CAMPEP_0194179792 /NCGR_PEP_ID=MMETSP0154-20130528/13190_1 /TAXON_ID=1049557 /ORGANISM="Thalassiothrix antarctica, Strain L6-D1" /LENGTH=354 /DNA_ID=CAMNT_0038895275 /DNA_START=44 /DNA_END=1109 /DNA_ORIENTATION=-